MVRPLGKHTLVLAKSIVTSRFIFTGKNGLGHVMIHPASRTFNSFTLADPLHHIFIHTELKSLGFLNLFALLVLLANPAIEKR